MVSKALRSIRSKRWSWTPHAALVALAAASCGFPAPEACELRCGVEGACPGGFECQEQTQRCVPRGTAELCEASRMDPNQPAGAAPAGAGAGAASGAPASGGGGGSVPNAGTGGAAGAPGGSSGAAGQPASDAGAEPAGLRVDVEQAVVCAGASAGGALRVSGGVPPYELRILENGTGLTLELPPGRDPGDVSLLLLQGSATPGQLLLEVQDSNGEIVQAEPIVARERPRVTTLELPSPCAGLGYAAPLQAEGGEGSYQWSAVLHPGSAVESLADLGLRVSGASLTGELSEGTGSFALQVTVSDSQCESEPVELALDIVLRSSEACPAISIEQAPDELPPACLGSSYAEVLTAKGGEPPYTWAELGLPPGLSFDAESATLSGVAEGAGQLRLQLADAAGRSVEKVYPLAVRDKCWLAYIATEQQPARLTLVDARLLERQPEQARRSLPAAGNAAALDFAFAASGRWLAYRSAQGGERRLELVRTSDGAARAVAGVAAVDAYAFSPDSSALAFSFTRGGQSFLGGLDVSAAQPVVFAPGGELSAARALEARAVPAVASGLAWYGRQLAFLSPDALAPARRRLVTSELTSSGFAPPVQHGELDFSERATLLESQAGVFVSDPESALITFFPASGAPVVAPRGSFVSPSGALLARAQAGSLQVLRPLDAGGVTPALSATGCSTLLAWSPQRELITCADERSAPGSLTLWQAQPAELVALGPRRDADVIASATFAGTRRAFSPSGSWFAVGTDESLHVARPDLAARLAFSVPSAALGSRASVLSFSPDERALLAGAANTLSWLELEQGAASLRVLSASALLDESCSEELLAGYGAWCGSTSSAPNVSWSSGSDQVAFRSALGTLQVVDLSRARDGIIGEPRSPDRACTEACSSASNARFQP